MYDIIGDVHSCYMEFADLLRKMGYQSTGGLGFKPPEGRQLVLVGDITDRGWYPNLVFEAVESMKKEDSLLLVKGNHDDKLQRWAKGNNVQLLHGLDSTVIKLEKAGISKERILELFDSTPFFLTLDNQKLVVVHGAWKDSFLDKDPHSKKCRSICLYGFTTGRKIDGLPERIDWAASRKIDDNSPVIVHGHHPMSEVRVLNKVWSIDTGCAFGNKLTALRYPEMEIVQSEAQHTYCQRERWGYGEETQTDKAPGRIRGGP